MKTKLSLLFTMMIALFAVNNAGAQYFDRYWKGPSNTEIGYSYITASAVFKYHNSEYNENNGQFTDTSITQRVTSKSGFGVTGGYYWPVTKMSDQSRLAITLSYMYNFILWDGEVFSYASNQGSTTNTSVGSGTVEMALPIGLDYKYGCDALKDKSQKFCASFGAGIYPSMDLTVFKDNGGFAFRARPFVKAEIGFFAGICFKLRATYVMGSANYINYEDAGSGYQSSTKFTSAGTAAFSLVLLPFSWKWQKASWYR